VAARRYLSLSDQLIAAVCEDGALLTFVAATGEPKWTAPADASSLLCADDEAVYVVTNDRRLRSVGRSDAKIRWTAKAGAHLGKTGTTRGFVAQGTLVITTEDGSVLAVDTSDGRAVWKLHDQADGRATVTVSGRTLFVSGRYFTARDISHGKQLWKGPDLKRKDGQEVFWGPSTVHGPYVYAAILGTPLRFDISDGKRSGWIYDFLFECDPYSPLVIQGNGFWSAAVKTTGGGINVLDLAENPDADPNSTLQNTTWTFRIIKHPDKYWMTGDGNRVFLQDGGSLTALPVF
jgi:outer membrane protein assembly factor BamB